MRRKPLALVTRAAEDSEALVAELAAIGLEVIVAPAIRIEPPTDRITLERQLRRMDCFDWVVFTSPNAVERCLGDARTVTVPLETRLAAVGPATAHALERLARAPDFVPSKYTGATLAAELPAAEHKRVLLLRAQRSDPALPTILKARGAVVDDVAAYQTLPDPGLPRALSRLDGRTPDWLIFASPSAAEALQTTLGRDHSVVRTARVACIGPVTAAAARDLGFNVSLEADPHTINALVRGLEEALRAG